MILSIAGVCGCLAGLISLLLGSGDPVKFGGVTLHGLLPDTFGETLPAMQAALCGWLIVCAGQAVLAKFAETYFKNELQAGTPFTLGGAKELLRLGVLTLVIPTGCSVLGSIAEGIAAGFWNAEKAAALDLSFDNEASIVLGVDHPLTQADGEAMQSSFSEPQLEKLLERHGFLIYELLTPADIQRSIIDPAGADISAFEHVRHCLAVRKL